MFLISVVSVGHCEEHKKHIGFVEPLGAQKWCMGDCFNLCNLFNVACSLGVKPG